MTALQSLPVALAAAMEWRADAVWYGIVPYTSMERAFALPLDDNFPSWFFRFDAPSAGSEYVVEVLDGKFRGANETDLPDYIEPQLTDVQALSDRQTLLDSVDVVQKYVATTGEVGGQATLTPDYFDFRLVHPKGKPNPIWTLYNAQDLTESILTLDAVTGDVLAVP